MPSWGQVLRELADLRNAGHQAAWDQVRRKYLAQCFQHTKRATILYATKWTSQDPEVPPDAISIAYEDMQGFMETIHGVKEKQLDLILHSPGGSLEAAEAIVTYLRSQFDHIRVIVPHAAMSAATMLACAADRIVMGRHSFLGPIDPQFILQTPLGRRAIPGQALLAQFRWAQAECQDPKKLAAWVPMLNQYGPELLVTAEQLSALSETLVARWLASYMFRGQQDAATRAADVAKWLAQHANFASHSRHLGMDELQAHGLSAIDALEADAAAQDAFLSVYHATTHTFDGTSAVKIIENHNGKAFIKQVAKIAVAAQMQPKPAPPAQPTQPAAQPGGGGGGAPTQPPFKKKPTASFLGPLMTCVARVRACFGHSRAVG